MWVIRGGDDDRLVVPFVGEGFVGIDFDEVPDAEILTRLEIRRSLDRDGSSADFDAFEATLSAFVRELQVGDSILLLDRPCDEVVVGTVTGRYEFHDEVGPGGCRHRRPVEWLARHPVAQLPAAVQPVARQRLLLQQHRDAEWSAYLGTVRDGAVGREPADRPPPVVRERAARSSSAAPRRAARPAKPTPVTTRTCPSCHLQTHPDRFVGEYCADCAE